MDKNVKLLFTGQKTGLIVCDSLIEDELNLVLIYFTSGMSLKKTIISFSIVLRGSVGLLPQDTTRPV